MFAVFSEQSIVYLGDDREAAMAALESKDGSTLKTVGTLAALATTFQFYQDSSSDESPDGMDDELSDAVSAVLDKLDAAGITAANAAERLRDDSQRALAEVKSLGIRGMNAVGEGFMALGELMKQADDENAPEGANEDEAP